MKFTSHHPHATVQFMGYIPLWLNETNPADAKTQLNAGYQFGGWDPMKGFTLDDKDRLHYPGDPPLEPRCEIQFRNERIVAYDHAIFAVIQPDKSFEACRMD